MHTAPHAAARVVVHPRTTVAGRLTLALAGATSPLFLALYVLAGPRGWGWAVLGVHVIVALGFVLVLLRRRRLMIWVTDTALVRIGIVGGPRGIPRESIRSVVVVETYRTNAPDTATQLLLQDADGTRLLRLDGVFWTSESITALCVALEKPIAGTIESMTTRDFFRRYPGSAFWFQRRGVATAAVIATVIAFAAIVLATMTLAGIPVRAPF